MCDLSVVTVCSNAVSRSFYLSEMIESVWDIANEIIVIDCDRHPHSETFKVLKNNFGLEWYYGNGSNKYSHKIKLYWVPWVDSMRCIEPRLLKSLAISFSSSLYLMTLDSDEVIHEEEHNKVIECIEKGHFAYQFHTIHFYRDYDHIKINEMYDYRTRLFKNNKHTSLTVFDMHDSYGGYDCGNIFYNHHKDENERKYLPLSQHPDCKKTSINIQHYGHTIRKGTYLEKKNRIEKMYHPSFEPLDKWEWDMSNTVEFKGKHPKAMEKRIKEDNEWNIKNGVV